ncbi:MAG: phytanoyl-CoA dioxygenase family protein [Pseudomonadota bacterium]
MLSQAQQQQYQEEGYLLLKGAINEQDILRLERGVANNPPLDGTLDPNAPVFPAPGRYTLATQCAADPDLGFIIEHPTIIPAVEQLLGDQPRLTAYVIYDRTPGGAGLPAHHDYKRWRPVGSSMNWLFTIIPFCDFDQATGQLFIAPGSHRLERVHAGASSCLEVDPAVKPAAADFVDPGLQRGDLLLMNMHLWHKAADNQSPHHRVGLFNKYAGASTPPATGYYLFNDAVAGNLSPSGKELIAIHSDLPILTTRVMLVRQAEHHEIYLTEQQQLPGGAVWDERAIADWDLGNYIAPAQQYLLEQADVAVPWLSYVGDYAEGEGLCRLYAYTLNSNGFPVSYPGQWSTVQELPESAPCWVPEALSSWLDPAIIRGKGLSQAQSRIDQFAY